MPRAAHATCPAVAAADPQRLDLRSKLAWVRWSRLERQTPWRCKPGRPGGGNSVRSQRPDSASKPACSRAARRVLEWGWAVV